MEKDTANTELIRAHVDTIILKTLQEKDGYPYDILREIEEKSAGRYVLKQATLYSSMKRLEKLGYINSYWGTESEGGRRRYYSLTEGGKEFLNRDKTEWEFSRTLIDRLLSDKEIDLSEVIPPFDASSLRPLTKRGAQTLESFDSELDEPEEKSVEVEKFEASIPSSPAIVEAASEPEKVEAPREKTDKKQTTVESEELERDYYTKTPIFQHNLEETEQNQTVPTVQRQFAPQEKQRTIFEPQELVENDDMRAAADVLLIGKHKNKERRDEEPLANAQPTMPVVHAFTERQDKKDTANYRDVLNKLFSDVNTGKEAVKPKEAKDSEEMPTSPKGRHIKDLQENLAKQGYILKLYSQKNRSDYYYNKYIYQNKLNLAANLVLLFIMAVEFIAVAALNRILGFHPVTLALSGVAIAAVPAIFVLFYFINPTKRIRANYNFVQTFIYRFILALIIIAIYVIICLVTPALNIGFQDPRMYLPWLFVINIPIYAVVYNLLYRSKRFHLTCPKF